MDNLDFLRKGIVVDETDIDEQTPVIFERLSIDSERLLDYKDDYD